MDRTSSLYKRAADLTRRLFASQPFYVRLARVFEILAGGDPLLQALGRSLGAVFLLRGVKDLPPVNGKPALEWLAAQPRTDVNTLTRRLPSNYLDDFAAKLRRSIYAKFGESVGGEAFSAWLIRFVISGGYETMHEGLSLQQAGGFVFGAIKNQALNLIKRDRHERTQQSLDEMNDDGDRHRLDPKDPNSVKDFLEEDPLWKSPQVRRILEQKAHPDAPLFLDLLMQGYTQNEIVGDWRKNRPSMLPHVQQKPITPQAWEYRTMPKILDILKDFAAQEMV